MTTLITVLLDCTARPCDHHGAVPAATADQHIVGVDAACKCHADLAAKLDVRPFDCAVSQVTWDRATEVSR